MPPESPLLSGEEALDVVRYFRRYHPARLRLASMALRWGDLRVAVARDSVQSDPFIAFRTSCRSDN